MNELLEELKQGQTVHVWKVCLNSPALVPDVRLLNAHECHRYKKIGTERARRIYLLNRAAIRLVLSKYLDAPLRQVLVGYLRDGRVVPLNQPLKQLNLSIATTAGTLFAALSTGIVGIDTELLQQKLYADDLSKNAMLAGDESTLLRGLSRHVQEALFLNIWVLKEAFAKAIGVGVYMDFSKFSVLPNLFMHRQLKYNDSELFYERFTDRGKFLIAVLHEKKHCRLSFRDL